MTIHYSKTDDSIVVMGRTFQHRAIFQSLGAKFNYHEKTWLLPNSESVLQKIDALCRAAGGGPIEEFKPSFAAPTSETTPLEPTKFAAPENPIVYSIGQLAQKIGTIVQNAFQTPLWISGELQNINFRGKAVYLNLSEPKSSSDSGTTSINAVIWQDVWSTLQKKYGESNVKDIFQEGMKIKVLCRVSFYKDRGSISLSLLDLDPEFTKGALALARQKLLQDLRSRGLDKLNKNLPHPLYPFRIGLISASGSRAYSDFVDQLHTKGFPGTVVFFHAAMQGASTPESVCLAMNTLAQAEVDLIVITRGGGSSADLRWFDDPKICHAACKLGVPIVAAIGHHDDISVLETIAFKHEKTPTAAAEFVLHLFENAKSAISDLEQAIGKISQRTLTTISENLNRRREQFLHATRVRLASWQQNLAQSLNQLHLRALSNTHNKVQNLNNFEVNIAGRDPRQWLAKGWVQIQSEGHLINSIDQLKPQQVVLAHLLDGTATLTVQGTEKRRKHDETK